MVKLRWLQVNKFRSVKPGTRLTFNEGYNVLLGQNGTGKTTLLNLVAAVVSSRFDELKDTEFELAYEAVIVETTALITLRHERRTHPLRADFDAIPHRGALGFGVLPADSKLQTSTFSAEVKLTSERFSQPLLLTVEGSRGKVRYENASPDTTAEFDISIGEHPFWLTIMLGLAQWVETTKSVNPATELLNAVSVLDAYRFDESLDYFARLGGYSIELVRSRHGVYPSSGMFLMNLLGSELYAVAQAQWGADRYALHEDQLPMLRDLLRLIDFKSAEAVIELQEASKDEDSEKAKFGNLRFIFTHRGGWRISEKHLSYGQKRMLAFMIYLATVDSVAIADELVNGLHHHWIRACIEAMGQRQIFLTSQNPLLLDYLTFQSPGEVRSKLILCRWDKDTEHMVWENMSQEAAQDFFDSYKVGFQQVGELLQSKGLW